LGVRQINPTGHSAAKNIPGRQSIFLPNRSSLGEGLRVSAACDQKESGRTLSGQHFKLSKTKDSRQRLNRNQPKMLAQQKRVLERLKFKFAVSF
jgi:hypothetical protein